MSKDYEVIEFQKEYHMLNNKFKKADEALFNLGIIVAYESELTKGFIVKKQLKTTNKSTKFNYKKVETEEELNDYLIKVKSMIKEIDLGLTMEKFKSKIEKIEAECV